jgi:hypothetical protein
MFNFLKSIFNTEKETSENSENSEKVVTPVETNNIIPNILAKKGLQYSNITSGYQIKLKNDYYLVIPFIIDKNTYFYLQKGLKDKNDNDIKCTYFFKIIEKNNATDIIFVNRIKILNDNIKCDENYSRIGKDILLDISNIVNDIVNNSAENGNVNGKVNKNVNVNVEKKVVEEASKDILEDKKSSNSVIPFVLGASATAAAAAIIMSSDVNNMKGGKADEKEEEKKYNNLKRLLEESLSESE